MALQKLTCSDGHELDAIWKPVTAGQSTKCLIVLHEIFGLTDYIEGVCTFWNEQGYNVLAPALFDRVGSVQVIDYGSPQDGLQIVNSLDLGAVLTDIDACVSFLRDKGATIGVLGYCWGGGLAFKAACDLSIEAAACVYPTRLMQLADRSPNCPVKFQFAEHDKHAGPDVRAEMEAWAPGATQLVLSAGHAFDRNGDPSIRQKSREALTQFFAQTL